MDLAAADLVLATTAWDLWNHYETVVPRTSIALESWWIDPRPGAHTGRAVLILDGLSLREVPFLLDAARQRGFSVLQARVTGAEIPADTTSFAQSLGYSGRMTLRNNGGVGIGRLAGASTDTTDISFDACAAQIGSDQNYVLWHHWPDCRLHALCGPGLGLSALAKEAASVLVGDPFWNMVEVLTAGRRLVITSDHGYAASGLFTDTDDSSQQRYLRDRFKSGRWSRVSPDTPASNQNWVPPLDIRIRTVHSDGRFVLGRRKWKSPGGYPTLTHGGLSLLEVAVPFVELSRDVRAR